MQFRRQAREEVSVNLTSLIDVVFLLLIFFMVSTTFQKENAVTLNLPEASSTHQEQLAQEVHVSVSANGDYTVNSQMLVRNDLETLRLTIENLGVVNKDVPFIISGDAKVNFQAVVRVMDVAGQLGFSKLSIATTEPTTK